MRGFWTLFSKEIRRFMKIWGQTVFSPMMTTSLYFLVFGVALGSRLNEIDGIPYISYVIPGLVMLGIINNSFINSSSSVFQSKMNGTLVDVLVAPMGSSELLAGYAGAAAVRGLFVGFLIYLVSVFFVGPSIAHPFWTAWFAFCVAGSFALSGIIVAAWAKRWEHLSFFPSFLLSPLTFLGGVFYSVEMLPAPWNTISRMNPILYMVNGLRYGLLDVSDVPVVPSAITVGIVFILLLITTHRILTTGWGLRD